MKKLLLGTALASTMLLSSPAWSGETITQPQQAVYMAPPVSNNEYRQIETSFNALKSYWVTKGVGIGAVRLVIATGDKPVICTNGKQQVEFNSSDPNAVDFCFPDNTVMMSQAGVETMKDVGTRAGFSSTTVIQLVLTHELGHAIQRFHRETEAKKDTLQLQQMEQQADCYGGEAITHVYPEDAIDASAFYAAIDPLYDPTHGTAGQRIQSFVHGASSGDCQ